MRVILHSNLERGEYFFSTDHCQPKTPAGFVPITTTLPHRVTPRPALPSGVVATIEEMVLIYHDDQKEIPNPDPRYQPTPMPPVRLSDEESAYIAQHGIAKF